MSLENEINLTEYIMTIERKRILRDRKKASPSRLWNRFRKLLGIKVRKCVGICHISPERIDAWQEYEYIKRKLFKMSTSRRIHEKRKCDQLRKDMEEKYKILDDLRKKETPPYDGHSTKDDIAGCCLSFL